MKIQNVVKLSMGKVAVNGMVDGGAAVGTKDFPGALPKGLLPIAGSVVCTKGFAGQTAVAAQLGTAADPDAFIASGSVLTKGLINAKGGSATGGSINADTDLRLTLTANSSFAALTDGEVEISIHCIDLNSEDVVTTNNG